MDESDRRRWPLVCLLVLALCQPAFSRSEQADSGRASVKVAVDAIPGVVIDHQPVAIVAGVQHRWPLLSLGLPPAELPPTGGS